MTLGMVIFFAVCCFGVLTHDKSRFEDKIFKHIPLYDWFLITLFPIGCFIATSLFIRSIILRPTVQVLSIDDFQIMALGILILIYAASGNSIHFTAKVLWRYMDPKKQKTAYEVNELFHGKFSHLLVFIGVLLIMFCMSLLEINHPMPFEIENFKQVIIILGGILTGLFVTKMIINSKSEDLSWKLNRSVFFIGLLIGIFHSYIIYFFKLNLLFYPFNTYTIIFTMTIITAFLIRKFYYLILKRTLVKSLKWSKMKI